VVSGVDAGGETGELELPPDPMPEPTLDPPIGVLVELAGWPILPELPDSVLISVSGS
jgi:hypothetical protein